MTIRWPVGVLTPTTVNFDMAPRTIAGPSAASGFTQVVSSSASLWKAGFSKIIIAKEQHTLAWRAIAAMLEGRVGAILVPLCRGYQPKPDGAESAGLWNPVPHSDGSFFSDDTGYVSRVIDVQLSGAVVAGATTASITINVAGDVQPGQHFSLGERLYRLKGVTDTTSGSVRTADIKFWPPAREAASAGDNLEFDDPVCRMRLATDDAMDLSLEMRRFATPTVQFLEDL